MYMGGLWRSNSWQTAACNPYQPHSYGKGQPSDTNHKLLPRCRRLALHGSCAAPRCWQLRPPGRWQTISPRLWWLQVSAFLSILQMLINTQGDDKRGAGLLPQGGGLFITCTVAHWEAASVPRQTRASSDLRCVWILPALQPASKEQQAPSLQASCIRTNGVLVDTEDMNTRAPLPGAPRGFFWLEHPRGRMPGRVAPSCCSAPRPLGQFGYSPAWFAKPLQSTEGNPLWRSCRYASSLAPQCCPALVGEDS